MTSKQTPRAAATKSHLRLVKDRSRRFIDYYQDAGSNLHQWAKDYLKERGITQRAADTARIRSTEDGPYGRAILTPYLKLDGEIAEIGGRYRNLDVKKPKFCQDSSTRPCLYLPPVPELVNWKAIARNSAEAIAITEGEFKALAATLAGAPTLGLGGVDGYRYRVMRGNQEKSETLPDFDDFVWPGREVVLIPDADAGGKHMVGRATIALALQFERWGASARIAQLPGSGSQGVDDLIAAEGKAAFKDLLAAAKPVDHRDFHRWGMPKERYAYTDNAVAERVALERGDTLRFVHGPEVWRRREADQWRDDADRQRAEAVVEVAHVLQHEVHQLNEGNRRAAAMREACNLEQQPRVERVLKATQSKSPISTLPGDWDADPDLLGVPNGIVDLRTGELRPPDPACLISRYATVPYDPGAPAPKRFEKFIDDIMDGDRDAVRFLQLVLGYAATGHTGEQVLIVLHGAGANGKSTLINLLEQVLGNYVAILPASSLLARGRHETGNAPRSDLASLPGKRLVFASEANVGQPLDEALVKQITGGDTISTRDLHSKQFEFKPAFTPFLVCNHLPRFHGGDFAMQRRLRVLPFRRRFKTQRRFAERFTPELPGILRWLVAGAMAWYQEGLPASDVVDEASQSYVFDNDPIQQFVDDCCERGKFWEPRANLEVAYFKWAGENRRDMIATRTFYEMLRERGFMDAKRGGQRGFRGLKLLPWCQPPRRGA